MFSFGRSDSDAQGKLPGYICKKVDKPKFQVTESEHTFLNHKFYYPGRVEWQSVNVTIVDPIDIDAANALQTMIEAAGYVSPSNLDLANAQAGPGGKLQTISKKKFAADVLGEAYIQQLDAEGNIRETWTLRNAWIKNIDFGSLDYSSDELVEVTIEIRYDFATQTQGVPNV